ncbi:F420-dependent glucose-6-phosphate dehydrogenase 1 [archaeon HR01]|nr:F420-dependent glucose-6-phosphate dehydrogenase 1 [archaeon HR01]
MKGLKIGIDLGENEAEPRKFVECAVLAEKLGFDSVWFGDHFMPWIHTGGKAAFVWSVMAAALERTERIIMGPDVTCVIDGRYHPALIAQAAATLDNMYPGRVAIGVGSGEAVNEAPFFMDRWGKWPPWSERIRRTVEGVALMRKLWTSTDYFSFQGEFFKMRDLFLYTKPKTAIPIYFSALGKRAAVYAGMYGDHLVTIGTPDQCRSQIFPNFEEGVKKSGRIPAEAEKMVLVNICVGPIEDSLRKLKSGMAGTLRRDAFETADPRMVESLAATVSDEMIFDGFVLVRKVSELESVVRAYLDVGAGHIVFGTGANPEIIKELGNNVLPLFR